MTDAKIMYWYTGIMGILYGALIGVSLANSNLNFLTLLIYGGTIMLWTEHGMFLEELR